MILLLFDKIMKEDEFVLPSEFKTDFKLKKATTTATAAQMINYLKKHLNRHFHCWKIN